MRILLVDPKGPQANVTHNVGLAFLSGILLDRGHTVSVIDLNNYIYTDDEIVKYAENFRPDWIGLSVKTALVASAEKTARLLKHACPEAKLIIGGAHMGVAGLSYMQSQDIYDFGLMGEGELSLCDLLEGKDFSEIPGLIYKVNSKWELTEKQYISDIEKLPYPTYRTWDRIDRSLFPYPMVHSRGCPYQCSYCSVPKINGRKFRKRSAESVIDELRHARKEYVFRNFEFIDDNFTLDIDHAKEVCEKLIRADLHLGWYANNGIRADRIDGELARLMKRSGCLGVAVGVESADEDILKRINKGETLDDLQKGIRLLKDAGIVVGGHFIVGLPGDTLEKVKKSIKFRNDVGLDYSYFNQLIPYPGTEVWDWVQKNATMLVEDVTNCIHFGGEIKVLFETPEFPKEERKYILEYLSNKSSGEISADEFRELFADRDCMKALVIRSARMDPYEEIREILPPNSTMDLLVSKGVSISNPAVNDVYEYNLPGLMLSSKLDANLRKALFGKYDIVIYLNTVQSNMNFDNILTIARKCGKRIFEYHPGGNLSEIKKNA